MIMNIYRTLEYVAGQTDLPPAFLASRPGWVLRTVSWCAAILVIWLFCGQSSKFIYIDF